MIRTVLFYIVVILLLGFKCCFSGVLSSNNIAYLGAFRLPTTDDGNRKWEYSQIDGMAYYPNGDGGSGSLVAPCRNYNSYIGHRDIGSFTIPEPIIDSSLSSLNRASQDQNFTDPYEGRGGNCVSLDYFSTCGLEYLSSTNKFYVAMWNWYNVADNDLCSMGYIDASFDVDPNYNGEWWIDGTNVPDEISKDYSGYLFEIPLNWATANSVGRIAAGRSREGGAFCRGPGLWAFDPYNYSDSSPPTDDIIPGKSLIYYNNAHDEYSNYTTCNRTYGGAWLESGDDSAVVFFEAHCPSGCYYDHAYICGGGLELRMVFYDPDDLVAVAAGTDDPWDPDPIETYDLESEIQYHKSHNRFASMAYDRANNKIFLGMSQADNAAPIVHVFSVSGASTPKTASGITFGAN